MPLKITLGIEMNGLIHGFRTPHHNVSTDSLVGGGSSVVPGEISLAHNGVLFLNEITKFDKKALDALRQLMEDKVVTVSRVKSTGPSRQILCSFWR